MATPTTPSKNTRSGKPLKRVNPWWVALLVVFLAELFFYTWCRVQCVQTGYAIAAESRKGQELKIVQNSLKIELARLKTPELISRVARERLSMATPEPHQVIVVP